MKEKIYNEVVLSGVINNIYDKNKYIIFGLICNNYSKNNSKSYISLRIYESLYYKHKDFFVRGNKIYIKGYLNSYSDKDDKICNYVMVTNISDDPNKLLNNKQTHIEYDSDGTMIWNGKRCEETKATKEEQKELEKILNKERK